mmetsp:Transcript_43162/g.101444  ORF Transcript_43162/g.101444 Transcript_43162/m.101444 type:complete len:699 (-) Transcript_43162:174-2270(-)
MGQGVSQEGPHGDQDSLQKTPVKMDPSVKQAPLEPRPLGPDEVLVMGQYRMSTDKESILGQGTSSICRKGVDMLTGQPVAIKVYKARKDKQERQSVKLEKFRRQVEVLQVLQQPWAPLEQQEYFSAELNAIDPKYLFLQLLNYSVDETGAPGPSTHDGQLYVVTEMAQYSLKDFFALRRQTEPLCKELRASMMRSILLVVAGLHAKGLVHIDLKPENLMLFDGRLKLIDVDGCIKVGERVSISDSSISFSPCYCAPEWARFVIDESESQIEIAPALDVWSTGITLCELYSLDSILKPMYKSFLRNGHTYRQAGILFMEWLSNVRKAPLPNSLVEQDPEFIKFLTTWMLVPDPNARKTCAECLSSPYLTSILGQLETQTTTQLEDEANMVRRIKARHVDQTSDLPLHQGTLWKLNADADPRDPTKWLKRDMWIASNGALCYFSLKENKRLVLLDGCRLPGAQVIEIQERPDNLYKCFKLVVESEEDGGEEFAIFGVESEESYWEWTARLRSTAVMLSQTTLTFGPGFNQELKQFRLQVKNRRRRVNDEDKGDFEAEFRGSLWKVKAGGDRYRPDDWLHREMWIAKNGALVYWSVKDDRELVYYTAIDIATCRIVVLNSSDSCKPWAFQVHLPAMDGIEFAPGEFAAESEESRESWIANFNPSEVIRAQETPTSERGRRRGSFSFEPSSHPMKAPLADGL